jgi:hypothetical protein
MAESLIVRKGGGGGLEINSFERTLTISNHTYVDIKKGDAVTIANGRYDLLSFTPSNEFLLTTYGQTNALNSAIKISENTVIKFYLSGANTISYRIFTRTENTVEMGNQVNYVTNHLTGNGNNFGGCSLGGNLFFVYYVSTTSNTLTGNVCKLNEDGTITKGTDLSINTSTSGGRPIPALTLRNDFLVIVIPTSSQTQIRSIRINRETLTATNLGTVAVASGGAIINSTNGMLGYLYSFDTTKGQMSSSVDFSSKHYFVVPFTANTSSFNVEAFSVNYTTGGFSAFGAAGRSDATFSNDGALICCPIGTNAFVLSRQNSSRIMQLYNFTYNGGNPNFQSVVSTDIRNGVIVSLENKNTILLGWASGSGQFVQSVYQRNMFGQAELNPETPINVGFASGEVENFEFQKFNDESFIIFYRDTGKMCARFLFNTSSRITKEVNTLNNLINRDRPVGVALEDGVSGQSIKVAIFK